MPKVLIFGSYILFFWVSENNEPIHIHVSVRRPEENSTKFWLTSNGGCLLANNKSKISKKDLNNLSKLITFNHRYICEKWVEQFGYNSLKFYV